MTRPNWSTVTPSEGGSDGGNGLHDGRIGESTRCGYGRKSNSEGEFAALADSLAARVDRPAVQVHERFHDREPDAEPPFGSSRRAANLHEPVENPFQHLRRNTDPLVANRHHTMIGILVQRNLDTAAFRGVARGVVQ